ncbi:MULTISPECIES: type II toxin-antitoxin system Phd/YefM family antitoxin [Aphanizomenonaceae]|uniref:Type II toxin-antitoxin system prevent-host-death family antitoxin n=1 Tax=Dolichospermum heterosporum TAC447 TaxID=747523 RepID=A0ABY5LQ45_9CYAN|nr:MULTISPECIES: type II toxin-antitoxin system prevent-host-death family antitoxin [Aphanizomenonaceae]MBE9257625.1 type II toxin-antitoxin system prevent-host-death family antitoxin [Dolichospermum sp. LEGE 00246]MDK2409823.1 type II toxin-antitoxin system prevent-host-death family antitoxin [Aphanizomenon sp. 202]MDK2459345.1 type II toxin-antitoxin system prevent-host-death family antitoxin [Aphanizomenon sp. PH219]UUO13400.1 type II toxin-antitoxin system prevent-host-death family antitoxi
MKNATVQEARAYLLELIDSVLEGEDVVISREGKPLVRLIRYEAEPEPRTPGAWEGRVWMADDFDDESEEINAMFYGKG